MPRLLVRTIYAALLLLTACDPNPSPSDARAYLAAHRSTIDDVRHDLRARIEARPAVTQDPCGAAPGCEGPSLEERHAAARALREEMLDVFDHPPVLGLAARLGSAAEGAAPLLDLGLTPGGHAHGRVPIGEGTTVDELDLGWGAYQTSFSGRGQSAGDGEMRRGIEVRWRDEVEGHAVVATLFLLGDDETTAQWRDAMRAMTRAPE